jgi:lantibiotic biosynthesis protein
MTVASVAADAIAPVPGVAELLLDRRAAAEEPPGFLTGAAGYALALHALAAGAPSASAWDACLLLR